MYFLSTFLYTNELHMIINMIAAMAPNRVIGNNNQMPWHYSEDFKHFKEITTGHVVVMWYNTWLSIGRPLPNRRNIVLSKVPLEGVETYFSIDLMMEQLKSEWVEDIFIIWGMSIYQQFLPVADYIYLTEIKKEYQGDTFFPEFEHDFLEETREEHKDMDFVVYKRK